MSPRTALVASTLLLCGLMPDASGAQTTLESLNWHYYRPVGLTEPEALRVVLAPAPIRLQGPIALCDAIVTVEILDAITMNLLEAPPPQSVAVGSSFQVDFVPAVGPPPARQEVAVRFRIQRTPSREAERSTLGEICPLIGSLQVYDQASGQTTVLLNITTDERLGAVRVH